MQVHQLFYLSSLAVSDAVEGQVNDIVRKASIKNQHAQITGILLFRNGVFLQLLEGPKSNVQTLFAKIQKDPRHSNIIKMFEISENSRLFPDWNMGLRRIGDPELKIINEILSWNKLISASEKIDNLLILTMLKRFRQAS
jgi:hypothetical protein